MLIAHARVETDRASRYLVQLCRHASQMSRHQGTRMHMRHGDDGGAPQPPARVDADWTPTSGTITVTPGGRCTLDATAEGLALRVEASDAENLRRIQEMLDRNLTRFGRRDELAVSWQPPEATPEGPESADRTEPSERSTKWSGSPTNRRTDAP